MNVSKIKLKMYPKSKNIVYILFITLALILPVQATNYNVSSATDIINTMKIAQPGDTLIMANGVWTNQQIVFEGQSTESNPIVLKAETPGYVILNGSSYLRINGKYLVVDGLRFVDGVPANGAVIEFRNGSSKLASHCRLTNTSIVNCNPGNINTDYKWVSIYGTDNRVDHCYFEGKNHSGATLVVWVTKATSPNHHLIDHNYFGYRPELGFNGGETIRIGDSGNSMYNSASVVEYNYFEHCNGEIEIISNKSDGNTYRYNTFRECEGVVTMRHGDSCFVYGNFFFGNNKPLTGGVRLIASGHKVYNNYFENLAGTAADWRAAIVMMNGIENSPLNGYFQVDSAIVVNNTIVNCLNSFLIGVKKLDDNTQILPPKNSTIANNLVLSNNQLVEYITEPINLMWEGNIMQGATLGITQPSGITLEDPKLAIASDELWRPESNSPAIGAEVGNYDFVDYDMDGQLRTLPKDVGADQLSQDPITIKPLSPNEDVGPAWMKTTVLLTLSITQIGTGNISADPPGFFYNLGNSVTLTAIPGVGSSFSGWEGDTVSTDNPIILIMNSNKSLTARFIDPQKYNIAVWVNGSGRVVLNPSNGPYIEGSQVIVTAIPDSGWEFNSWSGDISGTENPIVITIQKNISATVNFGRVTSVEDKSLDLNYKLEQNYPNPFNPSTKINYSINESGLVKLSVYSILGEVVSILVNRYQGAGSYNVVFDASNIESGVYFYKLESGNKIQIKKMILIK
ncbi:MAG: chondroitinase-B domain-containing protein [Ignavibacteriaceae bacterium]